MTDISSRKSYKKESVYLSDMPPLGSDKDAKEEKGSKMLTSNKLSARLPMLLAQTNAENNSN